MDRRRVQVPLLVMAVVAAVGAVDAWTAGRRTTAVMSAGAVVVAAATGWSLRRAVVVRLRSDLHAWVDATGAVTGEPPEVVVRRALVAYRADTGDDPGP